MIAHRMQTASMQATLVRRHYTRPEDCHTETTVIYIFERETEALRIETRYSKDSLLYEIIWRRADGTTTRETFAGETSFRSRLDEIYGQLEDEEWRHIGPPQLLAGGWKI
jgi:hypothetical protein